MSQSKIEEMYDQMRAYIRLAVETEVAKALPEIRAVPTPPAVDIEELERRVWERIVPKIPAPPVIVPPKDGKDGQDGKDGIATREELDALIEKRFSELTVRTIADSYREVYKAGDLYKRGEFVTWDGSLWLAKALETRSAPGTDDTWRLVVKRGREGRDARSQAWPRGAQ